VEEEKGTYKGEYKNGEKNGQGRMIYKVRNAFNRKVLNKFYTLAPKQVKIVEYFVHI
jgi:hypothetical protein